MRKAFGEAGAHRRPGAHAGAGIWAESRQSALPDRTFALAGLVEAHRYLEANAATGKVLLLVGED